MAGSCWRQNRTLPERHRPYLPRCWRRCRRTRAYRPTCRSSNSPRDSGALFSTVMAEEWIDVPNPQNAEVTGGVAKRKTPRRRTSAASGVANGALPWFRFQYKGLYPALEEAARLSPAMRGKLDPLIDEVECSTCDGTRLRDDAASVRLKNLTIGQIGRLPLERLIAELARWEWTTEEKKIAGELIREIQTRVQFLVDVGLEYLTLARPAPTLLRRRKHGGFDWPARSAAACAACFMCWMNRRSVCIRRRQSPAAHSARRNFATS